MWAADIFRVMAPFQGYDGDVEFAQAFIVGTKEQVLAGVLDPEISRNFEAIVYEVSDNAEENEPVYLVPNDERFA